MRNFHLFLLSVACIMMACENNQNQDLTPPVPQDGMQHDSLTASYENFCNPERGFHVFKEYHSPTPIPLSASSVKSIYKQGTSLILTNYYLKHYRSTPIPDSYLEVVRGNMQALREGGCKCILRFAYTDTDYYTRDTCKEAREAPVDTILLHISQIKPVLQEYSDVIFAMEAGFVGVWGEWYYTTHFKRNPSKPEDFKDYRRVLDALLDALPAERQICVRTPDFKMNCYGWTLADTLTRAEAYSGTPKSRLACHDDAFMSNSSDMGTFKHPDHRTYWEAETKYTIFGGESNQPSSYSDCDHTIARMQALHDSYMNISYHTTVIARWQSGGCLEDMRRQIGYRFVATDVATTYQPKAGQELKVVVTLHNEGFASPKNPRDVRMLLVNNADPADVVSVTPDCDPRFWGPEGEHQISVSFKPEKAGDYKICLYMPDPKPVLAKDPRYAIRLANKDCWDETTGYNYLTTVKVQ